MKKVLLICTILLAIVLSFAACGGNNNPPSNNEGSNNETPHTHNFGEWDVTVKPTCTENGTKVRYCSCGEKQSETVAMLGHSPADTAIEDKVDATYEADGSYKEVVRCSTCNEKLSEISHTIPMLKHTPAEAVTENVVDATCYSEGSYDTVIYCAVCNTELERTKHTVEKVAHTPADAVEENKVNATCYSEGNYDSVVYCSVCNTELSRSNVTLQKITHSPAEAVVKNLVNATCTTDGSYDEVVYCSIENCKAQIIRVTKIIEAFGHTEVVDAAVDATCTETGLSEGKHCEVCKKVLIAQEIVEASHNYVQFVCTVCGKDQPPSIGLKFTSNGDGTCSVSGIGTCTDTNLIIPEISPQNEKVTKIGHNAFRECTKLESVSIPNGVKTIDSYAFGNCDSLKEVFIPSTVRTIGQCAFAACGSLTSIYFNGQNMLWLDYVKKAVDWYPSAHCIIYCSGGDKVDKWGNYI